jgi:hypothetical protein
MYTQCGDCSRISRFKKKNFFFLFFFFFLGRGLATTLFERYLAHVRSLGRFEKSHLICEEAMLSFYLKRGYRSDGPSKVLHGDTKWFDCTLDF